MRKLGYRPMLELFTKTRPFTSPTSTRASRPWTIAFAASATSIGTLRSRAKWLSVPIGTTPSADRVPASAPATVLTVPSPPAATTMRWPASAARRARGAACLGSASRRICAAAPASAHAPATFAIDASECPPPDAPFTITGSASATLGRRAALQVRAGRGEAHDEPRRARADRGQHVARIVHAEVHAGEGDEEHHRDSREHGGDAQPEALDVGDDVHAEESVEEGGGRGVPAREARRGDGDERILPHGAPAMERELERGVEQHAAAHGKYQREDPAELATPRERD